MLAGDKGRDREGEKELGSILGMDEQEERGRQALRRKGGGASSVCKCKAGSGRRRGRGEGRETRNRSHFDQASLQEQNVHLLCLLPGGYSQGGSDNAMEKGRDVKSIRAVAVRNKSAVAVGVVGRRLFIDRAAASTHTRDEEGPLNNAVILRLPFRASLSLSCSYPSLIHSSRPLCPRTLSAFLSAMSPSSPLSPLLSLGTTISSPIGLEKSVPEKTPQVPYHSANHMKQR